MNPDQNPENSAPPDLAPGPIPVAIAKPEQAAGRVPAEPSDPDTPPDVIVVGAGLAGLACALDLGKAGHQVALLEASDLPGGRIRTDLVEGFCLDRGFQVLLTAYPEAQRVLDYEALHLKSFLPGALVRQGGRFHRFADPYRELSKAIAFGFDPVVPLGDKLRVAKLRRQVLRSTEQQLQLMPEETTREMLRRFGFTQAIVERFFAPFFGGIFLEPNLTTSARWFRWLFRIFSTGLAAVPEMGMEQIPRQLAARLDPGVLRCGVEVKSLVRKGESWTVRAGDISLDVPHVVLATEETQSRRLLAGLRPPGPSPARIWNRTTTFYYAASQPPVDEPIVVLNGEGRTAGPVNHLAVPSLLSTASAPAGTHLICANIVGAAPDTDRGMAVLEGEVRAQMRRWFGEAATRWALLAGYPIAHALPMQTGLQPLGRVVEDSGILLCGDAFESPSIQGALVSGRRTAAVLSQRLSPIAARL